MEAPFWLKALYASNRLEDIASLLRQLLRATGDDPILPEHLGNIAPGLAIGVEENADDLDLHPQCLTYFLAELGVVASTIGQAQHQLDVLRICPHRDSVGLYCQTHVLTTEQTWA